jgi:hypothetical protein
MSLPGRQLNYMLHVLSRLFSATMPRSCEALARVIRHFPAVDAAHPP